MDYKHKRNEDYSKESPTYSRLFIVCDRSLTEEDFTAAFSSFGTIEDIRMPRDHDTGNTKGIAYIKFSRTSEAAAAVEKMHGKPLGKTNKPLKVMVAANRSDIQSDDRDTDKYKRLYICVHKNATEEEVENHFAQFGVIDSVLIQRDRDTGESKGGAYVKFRTFSQAAKAFEECDKKYRPIFANPKGYNRRRTETTFESNINSLASSSGIRSSLVSMMNSRPEGYTQVIFMCSPYLTPYLVERIFDIVPGMVKCHYYVDLARNCGKGRVSYSNPISASYAVEKLHRFEYPPGARIFVKPDNVQFNPDEQYFPDIPNVVANLKAITSSSANSSAPDLAQLAEAIAEASKLIKMATAGVSDDNIPDSNDLNYCSVKLPPTQPLADIDSPVAKRCFLVCKPQPPPLTVLRDIFCRFGDLINVYTLPNKTVGYARYASNKGADDAMSTLHGAEICGVRIKVLEAEDEAPPKRSRYN